MIYQGQERSSVALTSEAVPKTESQLWPLTWTRYLGCFKLRADQEEIFKTTRINNHPVEKSMLWLFLIVLHDLRHQNVNLI
jgi:hypothetical protein